MVAEPILFLSSDDKLQVRCLRNPLLFCVKDFIREIANKEISADQANIYWLSIQLKYLHERDLQTGAAVKFPGPLEGHVVSISATGLLILMHYLGVHYGIVNEKYRVEIQDRLQEIIADSSAVDKYVRDFDDGELDQIYASLGKDEAKITASSEDSVGMTETLAQLVIERQKEIDELKSKIAEHENEEKAAKRLRMGSFCLKSLIPELELDIAKKYNDRLCRNVVSRFKREFPDNKTFLKRNVLYFSGDDRQLVESILHSEATKLKMRLIDKECWLVAPGAEVLG
jgi:hypothetical protein